MNNDDLLKLEAAAIACSPQNLDSAESVIKANPDMYIECPICNGEGAASSENDYCNFDNHAIGVQFYGIGKEFGAAEDYYRAANPAAIISLINRLRLAESKYTSDPLADLAAVMRRHGLTFELDYGFGGFQCLEIYCNLNKLIVIQQPWIDANDVSPESKNDPS